MKMGTERNESRGARPFVSDLPPWWDSWSGSQSATVCGGCTAVNWLSSVGTAGQPPTPHGLHRTSVLHPSEMRATSETWAQSKHMRQASSETRKQQISTACYAKGKNYPVACAALWNVVLLPSHPWVMSGSSVSLSFSLFSAVKRAQIATFQDHGSTPASDDSCYFKKQCVRELYKSLCACLIQAGYFHKWCKRKKKQVDKILAIKESVHVQEVMGLVLKLQTRLHPNGSQLIH